MLFLFKFKVRCTYSIDMSDHHSGKGYTPLPQSISNTDTEDEEDCLAQTNEIPKDNVDDTLPN